MKYVTKEFSFIYEEKKSKFVAHLMPYELFNEIMKRLKQEHPKARHHVYAYRYLNEFDQVVENSSDDGEPKGTSGKPSLTVLSGNDLINTGVIIVRYFGGIKLGTGGLVRAYSDAVNAVISQSQICEYKKLFEKSLLCSYNELSQIEYLISQEGVIIADKEFTQNVLLKIQGSQEEFNKLNEKLPRHLKII